MIRYVVTTHSSGANLSKPGHWGNIPFATVDEAERAARLDAHPSPALVDHERSRR